MTVALDIPKPLFRKYLDYLFKKNDEGQYIVSKTDSFGTMLCSMVRQSNLKVEQETTPDTVVFLLPKVDSLSNARHYHLYYEKEIQHRLNDLLRELFFLDFNRYYLAGKKAKYMQKDIINSFILSRNLAMIDSAHETIKKKQYREDLRAIKRMKQQLKNAAYNHNETMQFSPKHVIKYRNPMFS